MERLVLEGRSQRKVGGEDEARDHASSLWCIRLAMERGFRKHVLGHSYGVHNEDTHTTIGT
jgi:hypothetical protein